MSPTMKKQDASAAIALSLAAEVVDQITIILSSVDDAMSSTDLAASHPARINLLDIKAAALRISSRCNQTNSVFQRTGIRLGRGSFDAICDNMY